jgi:hypothetical protein
MLTDLPFPFGEVGDLWDDPGEMVELPLADDALEALAGGEVGPEEAFRLGVYAALCDAMLARMEKENPGVEAQLSALRELTGTVASRYGPLRFRHNEQAQSARARKLAGAARDTHSAGLKTWVIPRLQQDIRLYVRRIDSLRRALEPAEAPDG